MKTVMMMIFGMMMTNNVMAEIEPMFREQAMVRCTLDNTDLMDYNLVVEVSRVHMPTLTEKKVTRLHARISEFGITGIENVRGNYYVSQIQARVPGAPMIYQSKNFELQINYTVTPVHGMAPATLKAVDENGYRIQRRMLCESMHNAAI